MSLFGTRDLSLQVQVPFLALSRVELVASHARAWTDTP